MGDAEGSIYMNHEFANIPTSYQTAEVPTPVLPERAFQDNKDTNLPIPVNFEFDTSPEVVLPHSPLWNKALPSPPAADSIRSISSSSKIASKIKRLTPFGRRESTSKTELPRSSFDTFSFNSCGESLLLWKRNGMTIRFTNLETRQTSELNLSAAISSSERNKSVAIRLVSGSLRWISAVVMHKNCLHLLVIRFDGVITTFSPLARGFVPICLTMSRHGNFIALSSGRNVTVYKYEDGGMLWQINISVQSSSVIGSLQNHAVKFCEQEEWLIVATQNTEDNVDMRTWKCTELSTLAQQETLTSIKITTGYGDYTGVSSIFYSSSLSKAFIAAFSGKPYPNIIPLHGKPMFLKVKDTQIRCAAQSPTGNFVAYMNSKDEVFLVDLRSHVVKFLGELRKERKGSSFKEMNADIAARRDDIVYVSFVCKRERLLVKFLNGRKEVVQL